MTKRVWKYADFLAWFACNYANEWSMGAHWCTLLHSGWSQHDKILLEIKLQNKMREGGGGFLCKEDINKFLLPRPHIPQFDMNLIGPAWNAYLAWKCYLICNLFY